MPFIYKILARPLWQAAQKSGVFYGAPVDLSDGFIHFSTAKQAPETAAKHFGGQDDLLLIAVKAESLGAALKWEISRGGDSFPHLYAPLALADVASVRPLPLADDGQHDFTGLFA